MSRKLPERWYVKVGGSLEGPFYNESDAIDCRDRHNVIDEGDESLGWDAPEVKLIHKEADL